jgi:hypothetical protein
MHTQDRKLGATVCFAHSAGKAGAAMQVRDDGTSVARLNMLDILSRFKNLYA